MRILYPGHRFALPHLDGDGETILQFVQRQPHHEPREGVTNQFVLGALISRVQVLDAERPWVGNQDILHHLRMAMALHEARAILRHVDKGELHPEQVQIGKDGHFKLEVL